MIIRYPITSELSKLIEIEIVNCNTTINKFCNSTINFGFIVYSFNDFDINSSSYKDFQIPVFRSIPIMFSKNMVNFVNILFQRNEIFTDFGMFFEKNNKKEFSNLEYYDQSSPTVNFPGNNKVVSIIMMCSTKKITITRKFKKIQDVLGQIGGILSLILIVGNYIVSPFIELKYYFHIINNCFKLKSKYKNEKIEKNNNLNDAKNDISKKENNLKNLPLMNVEFEYLEKKNNLNEFEIFEENKRDSLPNLSKQIKVKKKQQKLDYENNFAKLNIKDYIKFAFGFRDTIKLKLLSKGIQIVKDILDIKSIINLCFENQKLKNLFENNENYFDKSKFNKKPRLVFSEKLMETKFLNNKIYLFAK